MRKNSSKNYIPIALAVVIIALLAYTLFNIYGGTYAMHNIEEVDNSKSRMQHRTIFAKSGSTTYIGTSIAVQWAQRHNGGWVFPSKNAKLTVQNAETEETIGTIPLMGGSCGYPPNNNFFCCSFAVPGCMNQYAFVEDTWSHYSAQHVSYFWYDICVRNAPQKIRIVLQNASWVSGGVDDGVYKDVVLTPDIDTSNQGTSDVSAGISGCSERSPVFGYTFDASGGCVGEDCKPNPSYWWVYVLAAALGLLLWYFKRKG